MLFVLISRLGDAELDTGDRILFFATLLVAVLVIVRQAVSIRENRILIEQQRTDLVSSISHELRTPLTAMLGWLSVLHYNEVDGPRERAEAIEIVHHQANYLSRIVEDLLLLVDDRDPTQMRLTLGPVDVRTTIQNAINATSINRERIDVEADRGLIAHVDAERLEQILVNLITNADRYGAGRCLVAAFPRGGTLVLEVHDAGPGVPTKYELMVWERFERGQFKYIAGERGREVEGTGIGLAVVETIAKAHGGRVGYRPSERLGGACFFVELPGRVDTQKGPSPVELPGVVTELRATS
jgi:two-component system sensor histidine kinase MtrB